MKIINLHVAIVSIFTYVAVRIYAHNYVGMHMCIHIFIFYHKGNKSEITELQCVSRLILIHHLSPVLILQLKRFSIGSYSVAKDGEHVSFPLVLNMAPYCTSDCVQVLANIFHIIINTQLSSYHCKCHVVCT